MPWPVAVILGFGVFWGLVALVFARNRVENVTGALFQGALSGAEISLAWWLAGRGSGLTGFIFTCLAGALAIGFLWHTFTITMIIRAGRNPAPSGGDSF
jgi:hypothetical protein